MKIIKIFFALLFFALFHNNSYSRNALTKSSISGTLSYLKDGDTVSLITYKITGFDGVDATKETSQTIIKNKSFSFEFPVTGPIEYVDIVFNHRSEAKSFRNYIVRNAWHIFIADSAGSILFRGSGALPWRIHFHERIISNSFSTHFNFHPSFAGKNCMIQDSLMFDKIRYLDSNRRLLDQPTYEIMKADYVGDNLGGKKDILGYLYYSFKDSTGVFFASYKQYRSNKFNELLVSKNPWLAYSRYYMMGLFAQYQIDSCILLNRKLNANDAFNYFLRSKLDESLRERLLTYILYSNRTSSNDLRPSIEKAMVTVNNNEYQSVLRWLKISRIKGATAFNFDLLDSFGRTYRLTDFKDKVVVLDFWFTGCGPCRALAPILRNVEEYFKDKPVVFITVNVDIAMSSWQKSLKEQLYTSPFSVNLYSGGWQDAPIIKYYNINQFPTLILIDKNGKLAENPVSPIADKGKDITDLIKQLL